MAKTIVNLCVLGVPLATYIKEQGEGAGGLIGCPKGGILLLLGVGSGFPGPTRRGRKEEEGRRKEGAGPQALNQFGLGVGWPTAPLLPSLSPQAY